MVTRYQTIGTVLSWPYSLVIPGFYGRRTIRKEVLCMRLTMSTSSKSVPARNYFNPDMDKELIVYAPTHAVGETTAQRRSAAQGSPIPGSPNGRRVYLRGWVLSFCVGKLNFLRIFSITQTLKDLPLMEAIKNYLNSIDCQ